MKTLIPFLFSLAFVGLEAAQFQSCASVTSLEEPNTFLVALKIEKLTEGSTTPEVVATPQIVCIPGVPAHLTIGTEEEADFLSVQALIAKEIGQGAHVSVLLKENHQVVLSTNDTIKLNSSAL